MGRFQERPHWRLLGGAGARHASLRVGGRFYRSSFSRRKFTRGMLPYTEKQGQYLTFIYGLPRACVMEEPSAAHTCLP